MPACSPAEATTRIVSALAGFLKRSQLKAVHFAEGQTLPPTLAFAVRFPRLSLTLKGIDEMLVERAGKHHTLQLRCGEAVFVPGYCWNKPTWARRVTVLNLLFGQKHLGVSLVEHDGATSEPVTVYKSVIPRAGSEPVWQILSALGACTTWENDSPVVSTLVTALVQTMQRLFEQTPAQSGRKGRDTFERICLYVQENFHLAVTRESVATQFRLNPNHLSRLFRREGSIRFVDYITQVRIDRAKHLLTHHDFGLDELSANCGFCNTAYFCRVFKKHMNQTPTSYRLATRRK